MFKISDLLRKNRTCLDEQPESTPVRSAVQQKPAPAQNTEENLQEVSLLEDSQVSRFSTREGIEEYKKEVAQKLEDEKIDKRTRERIEKLIYIEGRGDDQIDLETLCQYAKSDSGKWDKIEKLIYIEGREDSQFSTEDIKKFVELPDFLSACWERAYSLTYVEDRGNSQFSADEIVKLANLPSFLSGDWDNAQRFIGIADRGDKQFSADEICRLIYYDYNKVKDMIYIEGRGENQFNFEDINSFLNLYPLVDFEKARALFCVNAPQENQLDADTIRSICFFDDDIYKRVLSRNIFLINRNGENLTPKEVKQLALITDDGWINAQHRGLFGQEYDKYPMGQICAFADCNPLVWMNIQSGGLLDTITADSSYSDLYDLKKLAQLSEENCDFYINNKELCAKIDSSCLDDNEKISKIKKAFEERNLTSYDEKAWQAIVGFSDETWDKILENNIIEKVNPMNLYYFTDFSDETWHTIIQRNLIGKVALCNISKFITLSDEQWHNIEERKIFETLCDESLGIPNSEGVTVWGKQLPDDYSLAYAQFTDQQWNILEKRNVLFNTNYGESALEAIASLSDEKWEKLRASRLCSYITPDSVSAFFELSDDDIKKAEERIFYYEYQTSYGYKTSFGGFLSSGLMSLTEEQYQIARNRDIRTPFYSADQITFLASLSDETWKAIMPNGTLYIDKDWENRDKIIEKLTKLSEEQIGRIVKYDLVRTLGESNILNIVEVAAFSDTEFENLMSRNLFNLTNELAQNKDSACAACPNDIQAMKYLSKLTDEQWQAVQEEGLLHSSFRASEIYLLANIDKNACSEYEEVKKYISILDENSIALLNQGVKLKDLKEVINYKELLKIEDISEYARSWKGRGINSYISLAKIMSGDDESAKALRALVELIKKGKVDKNILPFAALNAVLNDDIIKDINLLAEAKSTNQNIADLIVPQFKTTQEAMEGRSVGDVFAVEGEKYIYIKNDDNSVQQLEISKETYMKLFPPLERFSLRQGGIGDCYLVAAISGVNSNPYTRNSVLQCFSEEEGNIKVKFPNGSITYEAPLEQALNLEDSSILMEGASGFQLIEHVYGLQAQQCYVNRYFETYDYTTQLASIEEEKQNLEASFADMPQDSPQYSRAVERLGLIQQAEENYSLLLSDGVLNIIEGLETGKYYDSGEYLDMQYNPKFETTAEEIRNWGAFGNGGVFDLFGLKISSTLNAKLSDKDFQISDADKYVLQIGTSERDYDYGFTTGHAYSVLISGTTEDGELIFKVINPWNSTFETVLTYSELCKYCYNNKLDFTYGKQNIGGE